MVVDWIEPSDSFSIFLQKVNSKKTSKGFKCVVMNCCHQMLWLNTATNAANADTNITDLLGMLYLY